MAKRVIEKFWNGTVMVKVYRDSELEEYSCVLFVDGVRYCDATTYYTADKADAISTASVMLNREYKAVKEMNRLLAKDAVMNRYLVTEMYTGNTLFCLQANSIKHAKQLCTRMHVLNVFIFDITELATETVEPERAHYYNVELFVNIAAGIKVTVYFDHNSNQYIAEPIVCGEVVPGYKLASDDLIEILTQAKELAFGNKVRDIVADSTRVFANF